MRFSCSAENQDMGNDERFQVWIKAFGNLLETLNRASSEPIGRGRYIIELTALATFVSTFNRRNGAHIFDLASKFDDLDNGRDDPIFIPADVKERPVDRGEQWQARARYVMAVEALIRTGTKASLAFQKIANDCPKLPTFAGKRAANTVSGKGGAGSLPERVLKNWRKEFQRRRESINPERQHTHRLAADLVYEEGVAWIKARILAGDREAVLAIASNVDEAVMGGVFSPPISH
jgi:hypothetical protein